MKSKNVKGNILEAVYKLSLDIGLENTSTNKIAKIAGTTEASIYYHFKNKEELFEVAFSEINKEVDNSLRAVGEKDILNTVKTDEEKYIAIWQGYLDFWVKNPERTFFYDTYIHSHFINNEIWGKQIKYFVFFLKYFDDVMKNFYKVAGMEGTTFLWMLIVQSALSISKSAYKNKTPVNKGTDLIVLSIINTLSSLQKT